MCCTDFVFVSLFYSQLLLGVDIDGMGVAGGIISDERSGESMKVK